MRHVVVIGGGITGLCCAYYLVQKGYRITLIDRGQMDSGVSYLNAGYITPSHIVPLASPGVVTQGLRWMLRPSSPFYIQPRWDPEFFRWGLQFWKSSSRSHVDRSIPLLLKLNLESRRLYEQIHAEGEIPFHYERKGLLMAFRTPKGEEEEHELAERARREGLEAEVLDRRSLSKLQPAFSERVLGAVHYLSDAHMTPGTFMHALKGWLRSQGVAFESGQEVRGFVSEGRSIRLVDAGEAVFEVDEVVIAAGSWTPTLASTLGLRIPIQGGKGYSMEVDRPTGITLPALLSEAKVAVTPMEGFTRFAGTMEFSGNNATIRRERVRAIARAASTYYRGLEVLPSEQEGASCGLRPVSPDGLPYIGRTARYDNLSIASGHAMMGWSLGPITGKLIAQVIEGARPDIGLQRLSPDRFGSMRVGGTIRRRRIP